MKQKDILDALRGGAQVSHTDDMGLWVNQAVCAAAADEIERLQARIAELEEAVETARADGWEDGHQAAQENP